MSSRRSSNVDEMVYAALAEESLLPKEKGHWLAPCVVDFVVVRCAPPLAGGVPCPSAVVRVVAGDDGIVPRRPGSGVVVEVAADDDGIVLGCPGRGVADDGAFEDPTKRRDVADGECGVVAIVDELSHVHALGVADGERGTATAIVLVVELSRDCN